LAKSDLHIELARKALIWLESRATQRGIRGCEEVIIGEGYIADAVAISGLTFSQNKIFCGKGNVERNYNSKVADDYSFIFESKVSRSDFQTTFGRGYESGNRRIREANFHFVVTPKGLVKPEEVPEFWGLLEKSGAGLSIKKMAQFIEFDSPDECLHGIAYSILRASRYGKFTLYSDLVKRYRAEQFRQDILRTDAQAQGG
jgi:hypothetical protein